jgi:hypothetical protein
VHATRIEQKCFEGFGGKWEDETPLEIPGHSWHNKLILKCTLKKQKKGFGLDLSVSGQGQEAHWCERGNERWVSIKFGNLLSPCENIESQKVLCSMGLDILSEVNKDRTQGDDYTWF